MSIAAARAQCNRRRRAGSRAQHATYVITHGFLGRKDEEIDRAGLERALSEFGARGWEFATAFLDVALPRE